MSSRSTLKGFDLLRAFDLQELATDKKFGVKAGVLENATNTETGMKVAEYAAYNEFGTSRIPSRPFLRNTADKHKEEWALLLGNAIARGRTPSQALKLVGIRMMDDIVRTISEGVPPPNAPATQARKSKGITGVGGGGTYSPGTLINTGSLIKAITYEVEE